MTLSYMQKVLKTSQNNIKANNKFSKVVRYKIHTQKSTGCLCTRNKYINNEFKNTKPWDYPGIPVVKTSPSNAGRVTLMPAQGTKTPRVSLSKINKTETVLQQSQ